jgi:thioredoxin 1
MKKTLLLLFTSFSILLNACSNASPESDGDKLSPKEFQKKINETTNAIIVDVRTPEEFADGHIQNAINVNWRGDSFEADIDKLNKTNPVFVYCLSGGRSSAASESMRNKGFTKVYELKGGILKWNGASLPLTKNGSSVVVNKGMSMDDFQKILKTDKLILVDFYAEWCIPCKEMEPSFEALKREMPEKLIVVRINVEENKALAEQMKIDDIPALFLYKEAKPVWNFIGFTTKEEMVKQINLAK